MSNRNAKPHGRLTWAMAALAGTLLLGAGCRQDMHDQPRYEPLERSDFYPDGKASLDPVEGTVARGGLREDVHLYTGMVDGRFAPDYPFEITMEVMQRGQERYGIFCTPCHDALGTGRGMVVQRGFPPAASFHIDRLRAAEPGYIFDVITRGFGRMQNYAAQIPVEDRWAIAAYVRALQLSQGGRLEDLPEEDRQKVLTERSSS